MHKLHLPLLLLLGLLTACGGGELPGPGDDDDSTAAGPDADGDGVNSPADGGLDCDDTEATTYPGAPESANDDVDSDCDGADYAADQLSVGDLVITEIMYDPEAVTDDVGEWFEVQNTSGHVLNLVGLVIADDGDYGADDTSTVSEALIVAADARVVFGNSGSTADNGGVAMDYVYSGVAMALNNSGDDIYLGSSSGGSITTIDVVEYLEDVAGGDFPEAKGRSIELRAQSISASANDNGSNWCRATETAGSTSDRGSPGEDNSGC